MMLTADRFALLRRPRWAGAFALAALVVVSIGVIDKPLTLWLHANISQTDYGFWRSVSKIGEAGVWYILAVGMLAVSEVRRRLAWTLTGAAEQLRRVRAWGFMVLSMLLSGALIHVVKFTTGRIRPEDMLNTDTPLYGFYPFSGEQSFPSGHSQAIFSAMVALGILFPRHRWWFIGIASLVAFSRVATYQHFLSDIIAGSAIGVLVTLGLARKFSKKAPLRLGKKP
ncbi:Membrane-associated phospholipid phosphatase [Caenispirillum salinarum AK4]|uniref:Membrane-associated phospholipid phosphatase n=1 Tax=Caenispirillum salinarum AK4 TaxID=1238182 RepID=K9H435_9PROT|nr:phosphatase PAP2 family protein [Caenispirillum salinarum]EKV32332.1 Membrane-associated phospholipid phosphatase [Caenispirillum salinarum AK4]